MLDELKEAIANCINKYTDMNEWRNVRSAYFWYTYAGFMQILMKPYSERKNYEDVARDKEIIAPVISNFIKSLPGYYELSNEIKKIDLETDHINKLYQAYISQDFSISSENKFVYVSGKNSRDSLGAYYTEERFAYLITEKAIDDFIFSKLGISNFSKTQEKKDLVYEKMKNIKFVDSCCGAGEFLAAVIHYCSVSLGWDRELAKYLEKNIYGYDVDPIAILITKVRIMDLMHETKCNAMIELGNPLIDGNGEAGLLEKYFMAAEGRFYCRKMGIKRNNQQFDIILGNPPWEKIRFEERKFFSHYLWNGHLLETKAKRNEFLLKGVSELNYGFFCDIKEDYKWYKEYAKNNPDYELSSCGELNTYALFVEWAMRCGKKTAAIALIVKASLLKASVYSRFLGYLMQKGFLKEAYMFTNKRKIFSIDSREEFAVIFIDLLGGKNLKIALDIDDYEAFTKERQLELSMDTLKRINPITQMIPNVKSFHEMNFLKQIYQSNQVFDEVYPECMYGRLVHLTNHSRYIEQEMKEGYLPIYEGKFIEQYNGKYATYKGMRHSEKYANKSKAALINSAEETEYPEARYYVEREFWKKLSKKYTMDYSVIWRSLTSATNRRTMIATILPKMPTCQSIQLLQIADKEKMLQILSLFNSVVFDYLVRLKMAGLDLTQTIVKQIAVPEYSKFDKEIEFNGRTEAVAVHVYSRIKYLYHRDTRLKNFWEGIHTYEIPNDAGKKRVIAEIDILIAGIYGIDRFHLKRIVKEFDKYYTMEEAEAWF